MLLNFKFKRSFFKNFIINPIGVTTKKKIIPIIKGAKILPKNSPNLNQIIECWLQTLLSVGLVRLFLGLSSFFCHRYLYDNALTGTIPPQISTLTNLVDLYAPKWHIHWVLVICFIECWSCAPLSQPFKVNWMLF